MKQLIKSTLNSLGYEIRKYQPREPDNVYSRRGIYLMRFLDQFGANYLLDVGANEGQYAASFRDLGFKGNIISFEPLDGPYSVLEKRAAMDDKWKVEKLAVGNDDGEVIIHVAGNSESSSILPMLSLHENAYPPSAYKADQKTKLAKIDTVCSQLLSESNRIAMKLDVQGFELQALKGAAELLKNVYIIDVELSLDLLYEGQSNYLDVIGFLEAEGFTPISFENGFIDPRNGHALQVDAVFIRKLNENVEIP